MKTDWLRKEDESEYAYIYRIGNIKEQIGSWQDVADLLNYQLGYQYTESKYRKDYAAFCKLFEANRDKLTDNRLALGRYDNVIAVKNSKRFVADKASRT